MNCPTEKSNDLNFKQTEIKDLNLGANLGANKCFSSNDSLQELEKLKRI